MCLQVPSAVVGAMLLLGPTSALGDAAAGGKFAIVGSSDGSSLRSQFERPPNAVVVKLKRRVATGTLGHLSPRDPTSRSFVQTLARFGISADAVRRYFQRTESDLDRERKRASSYSNGDVPDLNLYLVIQTPQAVDAMEVCDALNALSVVASCEQGLPVAPPPRDLVPPTPDFSRMQDFRLPPPLGIGVPDIAVAPGSNGAGRAFVDIENSGWDLDHEDLELPPSSYIDSATNAADDSDHGTTVLGVIVAQDNGYGVVGISPDATPLVAPVNTIEHGYNSARAVSLATAVLSPGDVILLEAQTWVCGYSSAAGRRGLGPAEWDSPTFDAIRVATALGIVVVEPAGNGGVSLDDAGCRSMFNRRTRDSGAIIVGAGYPVDRKREDFSSYGLRVDVQGWGSSVVSTGGGDLFDPDDPRQRYTMAFSGTSSAAAMVAGAVLSIQGTRHTSFLRPYTPSQIRELLIASGQPQPPEVERIGPLPNLLVATGLAQSCGNGLVEVGEVCDDGNLLNGDGCDLDCQPSRCGNGIRGGNEACDDGNTDGGDGCEGDCTLAPCAGDCNGDGLVGVNEIISAVGIALETVPSAICPIADANRDGRVTTDEIVRSVLHALAGCSPRW